METRIGRGIPSISGSMRYRCRRLDYAELMPDRLRYGPNVGRITRATKGSYDSSSLFLTTMHYSLRRALSLDSVDGCTPSKVAP
jgi:hypothetical protein